MIQLKLAKTWMIGSTVEEDDKVVRGPGVLIEVDEHLQDDYEDDVCDDGDVGNENLSPVEDGRAGLHLRNWVLRVEDVNDRHSAFRRRRIPKNWSPRIFVQQSEMDFLPMFRFIFVLGFKVFPSPAFSVRSFCLSVRDSEPNFEWPVHVDCKPLNSQYISLEFTSPQKGKTQSQIKIVYLSAPISLSQWS